VGPARAVRAVSVAVERVWDGDADSTSNAKPSCPATACGRARLTLPTVLPIVLPT
jgi:hypothetical protein